MLALAAALWPPLGVVAFVGVYVLAFLNTGAVYACPSCRKRVKVGATHCHHCGQAVA
jgi:hypothetical protein